MKIIYRGVDPEDRLIQAECINCKTRVEFTPPEAEYVSDQREGDFYRVACPVCGKPITKTTRDTR